MAESQLNIDAIISIFREIVKRKTTYNEINLHYEYFKRVGDTIPFKEHGFSSLRDLLEQKAGNVFYFEAVGKDLVIIAPKRVDGSSVYSDVNNVLKVKKCSSVGSSSGSETGKQVLVSNNIYFGPPQSTGVNNPFQNIRNDIKISFDFNAQKREVDVGHAATNDTLVNDNEANTCGDISSSVHSKQVQMELDGEEMHLPWHEKYWHLKITHPVSSNEIWARFFDEFDERMRQMTSKIIKSVSINPKRSRIRCHDKVFVVKDKQHFYRVIILKDEPEINQCECFLIDVGERKWFDEDSIFRCPSEFRDTQPMAMRFSLYGLTEFKDNRHANDLLVRELANKELWAKVQIKPSQFTKINDKYNPIPVILYNSLDRNKRFNINADIMEKMVATFKPPKLSQNRTNYVTVTHISKVSGNIYGHVIHSRDLNYVNAMIEVHVEHGVRQCYDNFQSETDLHELLAINANKLYLIYSEHDRSWYRATILQLETNLSASKDKDICRQCSVYCFLVDYGNTRMVNLTNVHSLPGILARYPHVVVAMTLEGVHMNSTKIEQLKTLLLPGDNVFVDVFKTIECGDSNKTKTISLVRITKLEKNSANNDTVMLDINRVLA